MNKMKNTFSIGDIVIHTKGGKYKIIQSPDFLRLLEHNKEYYYEYECVLTGQRWIRCKSEMEDGRFKIK